MRDTHTMSSLWDTPVWDARPYASEERRSLIALLQDLTDEEWVAPTEVPGWTVKDLALHLLDDDLGWLSRERDGNVTGLVDMTDQQLFLALLDVKNQRWIDAAQGLSRRVVADLLTWVGSEVERYDAGADLEGDGWVSWASDKPVPYWFNVAQEFTERWVHQQQIREALDRVDDHEAHLPEVLRTFVWAMPHQLRVRPEPGWQVGLSISNVGQWTLVAGRDGQWDLEEGEPAQSKAQASLKASPDAAWRLFTHGSVPDGELEATGHTEIVESLMHVRAAIV